MAGNGKNTLKDAADAAVASLMPPPAPPAESADWHDDLPQFYQSDGFWTLKKELQKRDPEWKHRWVRTNPENEATKRIKGWLPLEDRAIIDRLCAGLVDATTLAGPGGRLKWGDLTLWRMPMRQSRAVRRLNAERSWGTLQAISNKQASDAAEIAGRSRNAVRPFARTEKE